MKTGVVSWVRFVLANYKKHLAIGAFIFFLPALMLFLHGLNVERACQEHLPSDQWVDGIQALPMLQEFLAENERVSAYLSRNSARYSCLEWDRGDNSVTLHKAGCMSFEKVVYGDGAPVLSETSRGSLWYILGAWFLVMIFVGTNRVIALIGLNDPQTIYKPAYIVSLLYGAPLMFGVLFSDWICGLLPWPC